MKRRRRWALGAALLAVAVGLTIPAVVGADPDASATVQFGDPDVGSPFPVPPGTHDSSPNAKFNLVPRTVAIANGGTVTYEIGGPPIHQVAVCELGTTPDDVTVPPSGTFINDPDCPAVTPVTTTGQFPVTAFSEPGRYLILCNVRPHFAFFDMYGWVNAK